MPSVRLGIAIVTYNRRDAATRTLQHILERTIAPASVMIADDGSTDGTPATFRERGFPVVTGQNRGIAWNKNRALFYLLGVLACDAAILLEDDSFPEQDGWEREWIEAAHAYGHVNYAGAWFSGSFLGGTGSAADPIRSRDVSAQCSVYAREAILYGGYMDTRFDGYGFEHVEHSRRLMRLGYGGQIEQIDGEPIPVHLLIDGGITVTHPPSHGTDADIARNRTLCRDLLQDDSVRAPWRTERDLATFRAEIEDAIAARP